MKVLNIIVVMVIFSCAPRVKEQKEILSQEVLVNKVLEELKLDQSKTHFYDMKTSLDNLNETILVFAEEEKTKDEDRERYTSHIVIVNSLTGKIVNYFSESSGENGWVSDAIFMDEIRIDSTLYELSKTKKIFGVIVRYRSGSQPNPYAEESLSLFVKEKESLEKVLDIYTVYESIGEVNVNISSCGANFKITESKLSVGSTKTNGLYDILVNSISKERTFSKDDKGECNPIEKELAKTKKVLKFNGNEYRYNINK